MKKTILSIFMIITILLSTTVAFATVEDSSSISVNLINQDPDPAVAGDIVEIKLGIINNGEKATKNLIVELVPQYPFELMSGQHSIQEIGTVLGNQGIDEDDMKIIKYKVRVDPSAKAGDYDLDIKTYENGSSTITTRSLSIDIENTENAEIVHIDQVEIVPGQITPIKFTINNVGSSPLRDMVFHWENTDDVILPVGSDNTKYIQYLDVGDNYELAFDVIASANADPDLYKLDLTLTYDEPISGIDKVIKTIAGVYVGGPTDFDVAYSGNSNGEYSFAISNIGSVSASSVTINLPDQTNWKISGSSSVIIGNLNKGDYTIASFTMSSNPQMNNINNDGINNKGADNTIPIKMNSKTDSTVKINIVYTDSRGNRNTIEKNINVETSTENFTPTTTGMKRNGQGNSSVTTTTSLLDNGKWILLTVILLAIVIKVEKRYKKGILKNSRYSRFSATIDTLKFK